MDEDFESLVVTDPDLIDEGIDISGLRTETDVSPFLLGNIPDYAGIQYEAFNPRRLSDVMKLYSSGLPAIDTSQPATPPDTGEGGGGGDGGTSPGTGTITPPQPDSIAGFDPGVIPGPSGFIGLDPDMDIDPRDIDDYGTYTPPTTPQTRFLPSGAAGGASLANLDLDKIDLGNPTGDLRIVSEEQGLTGTPKTTFGTPVDVEQGFTQDFSAPGTLADPLEKMDFITEENAADPTFLDRIGLGQFNPAEAFVKAALNKAIGLPVSFLIDFLRNTLPPQDPRVGALNELYDIKDGTIQSGLMKGYNPVSGNPFDPTFGLQEAYQDRIDTIENTLKTKYNMTDAEIADVRAGNITDDILDKTYNETLGKTTPLLKTLTDLDEGKAKEKTRLDLFSGDIDERDQRIEDRIAQNKAEAEGDAKRLANLTGDLNLDKQATIPLGKEDRSITIERLGDQQMLDDLAVEEIADIADRQPEVIEQKKNELADIYDRDVQRGIRPEDPTITSDINKAKEVINMPQMLGDVGGSMDRDRDPDPSPSFDPGQGFVDQGGGGEFGGGADMGSVSTAGQAGPPSQRGGGGGNGGSSSGGGGCVIATHAVNSGAFTKDTKREAVRWCIKNLHRTWWGEAIRRGYRYYGQKAIEEGKAKNHYQEFKDYVAFGTGKRRTLKTGWTFVYRSIQFFIRGLING